jgi:putative ABC transport system permease protein
MMSRFIASLRGFIARRRIAAEIEEEIRDHVERETAMHVARGVAPDEARRLALRDLGGVTHTIEATRDVRATWLDSAWRDVRYAARMWWRTPRLTATAMTLLVLGIGSTTAIFSITYAVLVRPLPFPDPQRLVFMAENNGFGTSWPNFQDWKARARSFEGLAASVGDAVVLTDGPMPRRFDSKTVTANFFTVLRVPAFRGRLFEISDAGPDAPATMVISHAFWQRELGGSPAVIGATLSISGTPTRVIGVLPPAFEFMSPADVYVPLEPRILTTNYRGMQNRGSRTALFVVGRLAPRVSFESARAEMQTIVAALAVEYPPANKGNVLQFVSLVDRIVGSMAATLAVCAGGVALLLIIACVNLAGLLVSRSAARAHELGIRAAIGGSRAALLQQLMIEQAVLVLAGGVLGAAAGAAALRGLVGMAPRDVPRLNEVHLDAAVLFWSTLACCACAFVIGLLPALRASGMSGQAFINRTSVGASRSVASLRRGLMVAELAVATVLLAGSGLMVRTMARLSGVDPGFDPRHLQTARISLPSAAWPDTRKVAFFEAVTARLRATPGVESAALSYSLPFRGSNWSTRFIIQGRVYPANAPAGELPNAGMEPVTPTYFETMRIPLLRGRAFDESDTPQSAPVVVVNANVAAEYFPHGDPIGQHIRLGGVSDPYGEWRTVVGVVGSVRQFGADQDSPRQVYFPNAQEPRAPVFAIARVRAGHADSLIVKAIHEVEPTLLVFDYRPFDQVVRESSSRRRIAMIVLSAFGAAAVLLAAIGLYGVIAQGVAERRREIGVRMALGGTRGHILGLFLGQGLKVAALGAIIGVVASIAAGRSLASLVFGVTSTDPATLAGVCVLLSAVTLLACYLPARAATRGDPFKALRND